jgi:hypothetical protein
LGVGHLVRGDVVDVAPEGLVAEAIARQRLDDRATAVVNHDVSGIGGSELSSAIRHDGRHNDGEQLFHPQLIAFGGARDERI